MAVPPEHFEFTGDNDRDSALLMIKWFKAGIDLSDFQITMGKDKALKKFSKEDITDLEYYQSELELFLEKRMVTPSSLHKEFQNRVREVLNNKEQAKASRNEEIDKFFARSMLCNHESCIKLAQIQLAFGEHLSLKTISGHIVANKKRKINWLQLFLRNK